MKERNHLLSLFKQTGLSMYYEKYKTIRNKVYKMIKIDKAKYTLELVINFKESIRAFYGYVRSKQVVQTQIEQLRKQDDEMTQDDRETAEELLSFFQSVFVDEGKGDVPTFERHPEDTPVIEIGIFEIAHDEVQKKLLGLKEDKAPGPYGLHSKALKEFASILVVHFLYCLISHPRKEYYMRIGSVQTLSLYSKRVLKLRQEIIVQYH